MKAKMAARSKRGFTSTPFVLSLGFYKRMKGGMRSLSTAWARGEASGARIKAKARMVSGFTLVELLVVMTLILFITVYSISGYFPFITKIEYENVVMDTALNIREYQVYGIGTKQSTANVFNYAYGFHAEPNGTGIIFFQDTLPDVDGVPDDTDGDGLYGSGSACVTPECLKLVSMNGYIVSGIGLLSGSTWSSAVSAVDVTFKRPYLDAKILSGGTQYDQANICITDTANVVTRYVKIQIYRTGQISTTITTNPTLCQSL